MIKIIFWELKCLEIEILLKPKTCNRDKKSYWKVFPTDEYCYMILRC